MRARWLVGCWCVAVLAVVGCGSATANLRDWDSVYVPGLEGGAGVFVPEDWESGVPDAETLWESCSTDEGAGCERSGGKAETPGVGRRPARRRGGGEPGRSPPPLLNPRPSPEELQARERRAADHAVVLQARQLYYQRLAEARAKYPNSEGYENHHVFPKYLGGPRDGKTFRLPTAYHKAITTEFRRERDYRERKELSREEIQDIMVRVYSKYPIPQLIGIEP